MIPVENALTQCLFNHNLGLHENANQKQTRLSGKLEEEEEREGGESERRR